MAEMRLSLYIEAKQMDIDALNRLLADERRAAALLETIASTLSSAVRQQHGGAARKYHVEAVNRTVNFDQLYRDVMTLDDAPEW
jgi:hypothetical protein